MIRRCALVLAVACAVVAVVARELAAAPAAPLVEIRGIAVGFAGNYKLGVWTPVEVELRGGAESLDGQIELTLPDGDGVLSRVTSDPARPIKILPGGTVKTLLYARFGQSQGTLEVRFVVGGKTLAERSYQTGLEADDWHILYPMDSAAELVVNVGPSIGVSSSIGMIGDTNEPARRVAKLADARSLPTRWYGYEGVDRVVIATSQPDLLDPIATTSARSEALYEWVRLGGRVVMCVGREGSALLGKDTPFARLAPGKFDRMETLRRVTPLESYAEASTPLATSRRQLQLDVPRLADVRGAIVVYEGAQAETLPLVIRASVGFGHVVFVAVDLDQPPFAAWTSRSQLVDKLLDRPATRSAAAGAQAAGQVASLGYQDIAGQLRAALDNFLGVSLIPFWAVVLLVVGYIILIGPLDFWLVKKVFRRMEATWITFPLWVILVSVGAYAAAYALKGRDLRSNQVELVDVDLESQLVRGAAWINLLSPRPDSYDISYRAKPPGDMQLTAPPEQLVAWFGLPGGALGAMNAGGGQTSLFQRPYIFSAKLDAMLGVPIQVWSTKSITARWNGPAESLLEAELNETVDQMLSGTITNRLGIDLADARLLYDRWAYPIPRLAAGAPLKISDELRPLTSRTLYTQAAIQGKEELINRYDATSTDVPWILERMLVHEAIGGSGYTAGLSNRFQQFCDLSQHLKEGKAVLIVRAPAGGSELLLGGKPVVGEHDQRWTIYRFVIPVHKARRAVIETKDLTKKYGDLFAIKKLDIQLDKGDVFGFIGPNGAGKTTTMRILATLLNPTWGEAYVCGYSIYTKPKEIRRVIGYMPDFFGVYDDMKVIEYLEFFAAAYRIKGPQRRKICDEVLELVDLGYKREALVTSLSRGMTQRLGLARVLLHDPQVLLLDEPASGLDPRARIEIRGVIKELRKMGKTIMVSSHILPELADICNKIGIIERGELLVNADVADVMRQVRQQTILNIRVATDLEGAAKVLEAHPIVEKIDLHEGLITATIRSGVEDYSDLAQLLVCERGYKLTLFKEDELNLETAFMALTKGITS